MRKTAARPAPSPAERIRSLYREHADVVERYFAGQSSEVEAVARAFVAALRSGRTLLFFGNGGSAADAQHLAAEFVNRFAADRPALAALALTTDTSVLTSIANDSDFSRVFARQIEALGRQGDVAVGISTSGRSSNVIAGLRAARARRLVTVGFSGESDGAMRDLCDSIIRVPSKTTARIQEVHITVGHILCQIVDEVLYPEK
jgi:D-sedoheptulose 7-phosphate isomerase